MRRSQARSQLLALYGAEVAGKSAVLKKLLSCTYILMYRGYLQLATWHPVTLKLSPEGRAIAAELYKDGYRPEHAV